MMGRSSAVERTALNRDDGGSIPSAPTTHLFDTPAADEWPLVFDSWARSFQKSPWAGCVPNHKWDEVSRAGISEILARRGARVTVCYVELEPGVRRVMGYAVAEPDRRILHWLFVKRDYRKKGIGGALLERATHGWGGGYYTYRTKASEGFLRGALSWDPVSARVKL